MQTTREKTSQDLHRKADELEAEALRLDKRVEELWAEANEVRRQALA